MRNGLLLGLDGVGKTLLTRQLMSRANKSKVSVRERLKSMKSLSNTQKSELDLAQLELLEEEECIHATVSHLVNMSTQPTIGVEHTSLTIEAKQCTICEVGAQLLPKWKSYFDKCEFWIYVVDLSNLPQIPGAAIEFFNILQVDAMRLKPKLLVLNKIDRLSLLSDELILSYFNIEQLLQESNAVTNVLKISALTGENIDILTKWISSRLHPKGHDNEHLTVGPLSPSRFSKRDRDPDAIKSVREGNRVHVTE